MHMWVARSRSKGGTRSHAGGKCSRTQGRQAPPPPASCACPQLAAPSTARRRTAGGLIGNAPVHSHSSRLGTNRQRPPPSAKRAPRWSAPHRVTSAAPPRRTPPHTKLTPTPRSGVLDAAKELEKLGKREAEASARLDQLQKKVAQAAYQERTPEDIKQAGRLSGAGWWRCRTHMYRCLHVAYGCLSFFLWCLVMLR